MGMVRLYILKIKISTVRISESMYFALQHQCAVQHTSAVVKFIVEEMTHKKIEQMPVISDIQAGEILESGSSNTLAWDATDTGGKHINEVHPCIVDSEDARRQYLSLV